MASGVRLKRTATMVTNLDLGRFPTTPTSVIGLELSSLTPSAFCSLPASEFLPGLTLGGWFLLRKLSNECAKLLGVLAPLCVTPVLTTLVLDTAVVIVLTVDVMASVDAEALLLTIGDCVVEAEPDKVALLVLVVVSVWLSLGLVFRDTGEVDEATVSAT